MYAVSALFAKTSLHQIVTAQNTTVDMMQSAEVVRVVASELPSVVDAGLIVPDVPEVGDTDVAAVVVDTELVVVVAVELAVVVTVELVVVADVLPEDELVIGKPAQYCLIDPVPVDEQYAG
jgi:hypothetical protein